MSSENRPHGGAGMLRPRYARGEFALGTIDPGLPGLSTFPNLTVEIGQIACGPPRDERRIQSELKWVRIERVRDRHQPLVDRRGLVDRETRLHHAALAVQIR